VISPNPGFISLADEVTALRQQVKDLELLKLHLDAKLEWLTKVLYGPRSERRPVVQEHAAQQQSFLEAPVEAVATATAPTAEGSGSAAASAATSAGAPTDGDVSAAAAETARQAAIAVRNAKKGRGADGQAKPVNGGGRRPVNRSLRPVEVVIPVPESARKLADGTPLTLLG
jgi:hypothetical protein